MFNPGDTITHQFKVPFARNLLRQNTTEILVTYRQNGRIVLIKNATVLPDNEQIPGDNDNTIIDVDFSQQDSLAFDNRHDVHIQINICFTDGRTGLVSRLSSVELTTRTGVQHYREVMTGGGS